MCRPELIAATPVVSTTRTSSRWVFGPLCRIRVIGSAKVVCSTMVGGRADSRRRVSAVCPPRVSDAAASPAHTTVTGTLT